jgi:hypothetical protein
VASKGTPLGIGLGIDFAALDADLARVADKIEAVGAKASVKVGTFAGLASSGQIKGDQLQAQVSNIGVSLSQGIASGVRASSAAILGFAARINGMLDRLAGTAITMFQRIDAAMKFPRWDAFLTRARQGLDNFASGGTKAATDLDRALGGGFGKIAQTAARVLKPLFDDLGKSIGVPITEAIGRIGPMMASELAKVVGAVEVAANRIKFALTNAIEEIGTKMKGLRVAAASAGEASAVALMHAYTGAGVSSELQKMANAAILAATPTPTEHRMAKYFGSLTRGQRAELLTSEPKMEKPVFTPARAAPQMLKGYVAVLRDITAIGKQATAVIVDMGRAAAATPVAQFAGRSAVLFGQALLQMVRFGAGTASAFLGVGQRIYQLRNFVSSLGSVSSKTFTELYTSHGLFKGSLLGSIKLVKALSGAIWDLVTLRAFRRVSQDAGTLGASVRATTGAVGRLTGSVSRLGMELFAAFGLIGVTYKLVQFFKGGVAGAVDLNEKVSESKVVFGAFTGQVVAQADAVSKKFGIMRAEQVQVANQFGEMAQGAGMAESASAGFANQMTELTLNLAKFQTIPIAEAAEKIRMGLGGSGRAMKQYGVFLDDAKVKGVALADGVELVGKSLEVEDSVATRAAIVMHDLSYVMGTLDRFSGGAAAQFKKAGGGVAEFGVRIGEVMMPAVEKLTDAFNTLLASLLDLFERNLPVITSWAATVKDKMKSVGMVIRNFGDYWRIAQIKAEEFFANFIINMDTWADNLQTIMGRVAKNGLGQLAKDEANDFVTSTANVIGSGANIIDAAWNKITKGKEFNPVLMRPSFQTKNTLFGEGQPGEPKLKPTPSPVSLQDKIDKIMDDIAKREAAIPEIQPVPPPKKPPPLPETAQAKHADYKLAGAVEVSSKEAAATIARSLSPGARLADPARQGLVIAKDSNSALHQIAANTGRRAVVNAPARLPAPAAAAAPAGVKPELFGNLPPAGPRAFGGPVAPPDAAAARADLAAENKMLAARAEASARAKAAADAGAVMRRMADIADRRADLEEENRKLLAKVADNTKARQGPLAVQAK